MIVQTQTAAVVSRGVMHFTVANNGLVRLGGANQTPPTAAEGTFLTNGIPMNPDKSHFAERERDEASGHSIKHARIRLVSTAGATSGVGAVRVSYDGIDPDATHGEQFAIGDIIELKNSRQAIFNFALINLSGGNLAVDVECDE